MAISTKPNRLKTETAEANVQSIINKGGSVALSAVPEVKEEGSLHKDRKSVLVKLPQKALKDIEKLLEKRPVRITRQTWIEEAVQEKLVREGRG